MPLPHWYATMGNISPIPAMFSAESMIGRSHCRFIVEQHGGKLLLTSIKGIRLEITFTLPLSRQI
jgi:hypothetical protein